MSALALERQNQQPSTGFPVPALGPVAAASIPSCRPMSSVQEEIGGCYQLDIQWQGQTTVSRWLGPQKAHMSAMCKTNMRRNSQRYQRRVGPCAVRILLTGSIELACLLHALLRVKLDVAPCVEPPCVVWWYIRAMSQAQHRTAGMIMFSSLASQRPSPW